MNVRHIVLGLSTAATIATTATSCTATPTGTSTPPATPAATHMGDAQVDDGGLSYSAECGTGSQVLTVTPDNPATRAAAAKFCGETSQEIANAPWPSGVSVVPFPTGGFGG